MTNESDELLEADDPAELKRLLAEARAYKELWQAILRTAVDPIIVIDERGIIQRANTATTRMFGYSREELMGNNVSMLMPEPDRSAHDGYLERYAETGEASIIGIGREVTARRKDGSVLPMHLAVSDLQHGDQTLYTGIIHDLSEVKQHETALRDLNASLEQRVTDRTEELERSLTELARSNRDLEQFAYIASHDLQAPLRNVRQGLELLDEHLVETGGQGFDDEATELRDLTFAAISRMEELIRGLLSYSRVNRQSAPVGEVVELSDVVDQVIAQLQLALTESGAEVTRDELPGVVGDEVQLRQVMQNLIQNAVKYRSPDKAPSVHIGSESSDGWAVVSVRDNGIGIDPDQHHRIFELFRRAHAGYDGVGLGLAICQRIIERHGGEIWVESDEGRGATFSFRLPMEADELPAEGEEQ